MLQMRDEIPQWCWYNGQILFELDEKLATSPDQSIGEFIREFKEIRGLPSLNLKNQGLLISLLYGLLIVPKEIWQPGSSKAHFPFRTRDHFKMVCPAYVSTEEFLRLLRNSIAHANFEVLFAQNGYRFWNINPKGAKNFEVEVSHGHLGDFVSEIGKYFINEVRPSRF